MSPEGSAVSTVEAADSVVRPNADLDDRIAAVIEEAGLCRPRNRFFNAARSVEAVSPRAGLEVGWQWRAMTKSFMLTTIASLGLLAVHLNRESAPSREVLGAFQTAYRVIADDLTNLAPEFSAVAPKGVDGMHYLWWEESILGPLTRGSSGAGAAEAVTGFTVGVRALLANMDRLAASPLGAGVQLRIVETIALDIAVAFRRMYAKVRIDGRTAYPGKGGLAWMDSHIKAETVHAASVSDDETGTTAIAATAAERAEMLTLAQEYAANWARALDEFATALLAAPARNSTR